MPTPLARMKFEMVVLAYRRKLYAMACRVCANQSDADDVVQAAIERVLIALPRLRSVAAPVLHDYLIMTLRNVVLDRARKRRNELLHAGLHTVEDEPESPEEGLERWRLLDDETLLAAEAMLSERQRQAWALRREGKSYREIAEAMGVLPGSVGKLLFDARERVRELCLERAEKKK